MTAKIGKFDVLGHESIQPKLISNQFINITYDSDAQSFSISELSQSIGHIDEFWANTIY